MKKINFNLKEKSSLSKDQMRKIVGGYGDGCGARCYGDTDCGRSGSGGEWWCNICVKDRDALWGGCGERPIYG